MVKLWLHLNLAIKQTQAIIVPSLSYQPSVKYLNVQSYSYLSLNNLLSQSQFGFRPRLSTSIALLEYCDNILISMENLKSNWSGFLRSLKGVRHLGPCLSSHKIRVLWSLRDRPQVVHFIFSSEISSYESW